jgi:putative membrane protein
MEFLLRLIISALAVLMTAFLLPGVELKSGWTALVVATVLSVLNAIIKPVLVFLTIPITLVTFGVFLLFINAFIIMLVDRIVPGFSVHSFWTAFLFSIILSLTMSLLERLAKRQP